MRAAARGRGQARRPSAAAGARSRRSSAASPRGRAAAGSSATTRQRSVASASDARVPSRIPVSRARPAAPAAVSVPGSSSSPTTPGFEGIRGTSLPPGVAGDEHGVLLLKLDRVVWEDSVAPTPASVGVRVRWWGDTDGGTLLRLSPGSSGAAGDDASSLREATGVFPLRARLAVVLKYLRDMRVLPLDIIDLVSHQILGVAHLSFLALSADTLRLRGLSAPVLSHSDDSVAVGSLHASVMLSLSSPSSARPSVLSPFHVNERIAQLAAGTPLAPASNNAATAAAASLSLPPLPLDAVDALLARAEALRNSIAVDATASAAAAQSHARVPQTGSVDRAAVSGNSNGDVDGDRDIREALLELDRLGLAPSAGHSACSSDGVSDALLHELMRSLLPSSPSARRRYTAGHGSDFDDSFDDGYDDDDDDDDLMRAEGLRRSPSPKAYFLRDDEASQPHAVPRDLAAFCTTAPVRIAVGMHDLTFLGSGSAATSSWRIHYALPVVTDAAQLPRMDRVVVHSGMTQEGGVPRVTFDHETSFVTRLDEHALRFWQRCVLQIDVFRSSSQGPDIRLGRAYFPLLDVLQRAQHVATPSAPASRTRDAGSSAARSSPAPAFVFHHDLDVYLSSRAHPRPSTDALVVATLGVSVRLQRAAVSSDTAVAQSKPRATATAVVPPPMETPLPQQLLVHLSEVRLVAGVQSFRVACRLFDSVPIRTATYRSQGADVPTPLSFVHTASFVLDTRMLQSFLTRAFFFEVWDSRADRLVGLARVPLHTAAFLLGSRDAVEPAVIANSSVFPLRDPLSGTLNGCITVYAVLGHPQEVNRIHAQRQGSVPAAVPPDHEANAATTADAATSARSSASRSSLRRPRGLDVSGADATPRRRRATSPGAVSSRSAPLFRKRDPDEKTLPDVPPLPQMPPPDELGSRRAQMSSRSAPSRRRADTPITSPRSAASWSGGEEDADAEDGGAHSLASASSTRAVPSAASSASSLGRTSTAPSAVAPSLSASSSRSAPHPSIAQPSPPAEGIDRLRMSSRSAPLLRTVRFEAHPDTPPSSPEDAATGPAASPRRSSSSSHKIVFTVRLGRLSVLSPGTSSAGYMVETLFPGLVTPTRTDRVAADEHGVVALTGNVTTYTATTSEQRAWTPCAAMRIDVWRDDALLARGAIPADVLTGLAGAARSDPAQHSRIVTLTGSNGEIAATLVVQLSVQVSTTLTGAGADDASPAVAAMFRQSSAASAVRASSRLALPSHPELEVSIRRATGLRPAAVLAANARPDLQILALTGVHAYASLEFPFPVLPMVDQRVAAAATHTIATPPVSHSFAPEWHFVQRVRVRSAVDLLQAGKQRDATLRVWNRLPASPSDSAEVLDSSIDARTTLLASTRIPLLALLTEARSVSGWYNVFAAGVDGETAVGSVELSVSLVASSDAPSDDAAAAFVVEHSQHVAQVASSPLSPQQLISAISHDSIAPVPYPADVSADDESEERSQPSAHSSRLRGSGSTHSASSQHDRRAAAQRTHDPETVASAASQTSRPSSVRSAATSPVATADATLASLPSMDVKVTIAQALRLPLQASVANRVAVPPSASVSLQWHPALPVIQTSVASASTCPRWDADSLVRISLVQTPEEEEAVLAAGNVPLYCLRARRAQLLCKVWGRVDADAAQVLIGVAAVDLWPLFLSLDAVPTVGLTGWYHILDYNDQSHGQLSLSLRPISVADAMHQTVRRIMELAPGEPSTPIRRSVPAQLVGLPALPPAPLQQSASAVAAAEEPDATAAPAARSAASADPSVLLPHVQHDFEAEMSQRLDALSRQGDRALLLHLYSSLDELASMLHPPSVCATTSTATDNDGGGSDSDDHDATGVASVPDVATAVPSLESVRSVRSAVTTPRSVIGAVTTPRRAAAESPRSVPGDVTTPRSVPGSVTTPRRAAAESPRSVPGDVTTPRSVPGSVTTPRRAAAESPRSVPGDVTTPRSVPGSVTTPRRAATDSPRSVPAHVTTPRLTAACDAATSAAQQHDAVVSPRSAPGRVTTPRSTSASTKPAPSLNAMTPRSQRGVTFVEDPVASTEPTAPPQAPVPETARIKVTLGRSPRRDAPRRSVYDDEETRRIARIFGTTWPPSSNTSSATSLPDLEQ